MTTMTHDRLRVLGPLEFQSVTMLSFSVRGNEHGRMEITGYINSDRGLEQLYKDFKGTPVALYGAEEGSDKLLPIFAGKIEQVILHATGGQIIAECVALTCTADLDRQRKSRSFQDIGMTYADVIWSVLGDTPKAGANFTLGEDIPIGRPIIQYEETDWEFIKRLASELKVQLFADCRAPAPQFDLGLPGYQSDYEFITPNYICKIDERFYLLGGSQTGQYKPDFLCYIVEDGRSLRVGSSVQWQQTTLLICEQLAELRKGELVFTYTLGRRGLVGIRPYQNKKLTGLALGGTVRSTQGEQVTLALDIDEGRNAGSYLFPWRPESGNLMYCMPKVGTRAMLYLQDSDAGSAIAINSPRENGQSCGAMADANMRCFTTEHGKQLFMYPDSMGVKGGAPDSPVQIKLDEKSGLVMESAHAVQMIARQGIVISAPTVGASAPQQLLIQQSPSAAEKDALIIPKGTADPAQAAQIIANISETMVPLAASPQGSDTFVNIKDLVAAYGDKITYTQKGATITLKIDDRTTINLTAFGNSQGVNPNIFTTNAKYNTSGLGNSSMIGQRKALIEGFPIKYRFDNAGNAYIDASSSSGFMQLINSLGINKSFELKASSNVTKFIADWEHHNRILANGNYAVDDTDQKNGDHSLTTYGGLVIARKNGTNWEGVNGFSDIEVEQYRQTGVPKNVYEMRKNAFYANAERQINQFLKDNNLHLSQHQFDALFSFTWNYGYEDFNERDTKEDAVFGKGSYLHDFLDVLAQPGFLTNPSEEQKFLFDKYFGNYIRQGIRRPGLWARRMDELSIFWNTDKAYSTYYRDMPNQTQAAVEWLERHGNPGLGK